jgi:hypothetical protein
MTKQQTAEHQRLADSENRSADWKEWGPYLSERAWGTVREDYSEDGNAWTFFPHDHARSRAYRWNEDGLGGFCNRFQNICLSVALWNEHDAILKERLFGLTGPEGNHGEDVKEYYYYLDGTPTHSYMKMLYKYPQAEFPYGQLVDENGQRGYEDEEYELIDALRDTFEDNRYFDVFIEYAKAAEEDILCRITVVNRADVPAPIHILPHVWFRNTWSWGYNNERPDMHLMRPGTIRLNERHLDERWWYVSVDGEKTPRLLFTENETNLKRLYDEPNPIPYVKDGINDFVVDGAGRTINTDGLGTKAAAHVKTELQPGQSITVNVRFSSEMQEEPFADFNAVFEQRIRQADDFYDTIHSPKMTDDEKRVQRQALAGLLWTKQFYHYSVELWLKGDPNQPAPPEAHRQIRNANWQHVYALDVISMPDKWEYPWFAAWDLAFHAIPIAMIDPEWAKRQLILLLREWYMHPNGQFAAYEWSFSDVNPPVHAWACWEVYKLTGRDDTDFLEKVFHKLLLNFTWWVNRKDADGNNVFQGGFLGLDNIGVFNRSEPLPDDAHIDQADGTAWMAMYCLNMLTIALELAQTKPSYEDVATKFFEHFIYIANAFSNIGGQGVSLWNEQDGFFYDVLHNADGNHTPMKTRSFVGLIPLFAVETIRKEQLDALPRFRRRMEWFMRYRPKLTQNVASFNEQSATGHLQLSVVNREQLERILDRLFDKKEFLSDYGLRSLSKFHLKKPFTCSVNGSQQTVGYEPGESPSGLFGGNSNWRGPIWFPINYLMIQSLRKFYFHYYSALSVELPYGSENWVTLDEAANELSRRLANIFLQDREGYRAVYGDEDTFQYDPNWRDHILFYEYFHGDTGKGLGASHQTGWTALVAHLLKDVRRG